MMPTRTLLVGGLSTVHDPLLAAALRGCGHEVEALHPRTDTGLKLARALGNHGQCNPAHYSIGAVLEHAQSSRMDARTFCESRTWLTVGSCGPCRLAAFSHEYARVLGGAGLGGLPLLLVDQLAFSASSAHRADSPVGRKEATALLGALVAADMIVQVAHELRPYAIDPADVDGLARDAVKDVAVALEHDGMLDGALRRLGERRSGVPCDRTRVLPRVLLVGEPWTTLADGDPSYDLARRLGIFGAEVVAPNAADWLRFRVWEERSLRPDAEHALVAADAVITSAWERLAAAAGCRAALADPEELAALARPHYDPRIRGGSAHLEVGRALQAARDRTAHLVLSLKPFGCLPSSSLSDGMLSVLLRRPGGPSFLAIETTGDADATAESRLEMALHAATLVAMSELDAACAAASITTRDGLDLLASLDHEASPSVPRHHACTAAELVRVLAGRAAAPTGPVDRRCEELLPACGYSSHCGFRVPCQ